MYPYIKLKGLPLLTSCFSHGSEETLIHMNEKKNKWPWRRAQLVPVEMLIIF